MSCAGGRFIRRAVKWRAVEFDAGGDTGKVTVMDRAASSHGRPCRTRCRVEVRQRTELQLRVHSKR